jgi:prophage regulatory protein
MTSTAHRARVSQPCKAAHPLVASQYVEHRTTSTDATVPTNGPMRLLRLPEVCRVAGLGRAMIYRLQARGSFPQSVKITEHAVGWIDTEVQAWLARRAGLRRSNAEPASALSDATAHNENCQRPSHIHESGDSCAVSSRSNLSTAALANTTASASNKRSPSGLASRSRRRCSESEDQRT